MDDIQNTQSFRRFAKNLFVSGKIFSERKKAQEDVNEQLHRMKRSIIKMRLSYKDIDVLRHKIENLINWERQYAKLFKPEDKETIELQKRLAHLEEQLSNERKEKYKIIEDNADKINNLTDSINHLKSRMNELLIERAKRHQRLTALDKKIKEKVDVHKYYQS